ncbi:hypothetical protein C0J52_09161, partial [Blattella germanica]
YPAAGECRSTRGRRNVSHQILYLHHFSSLDQWSDSFVACALEISASVKIGLQLCGAVNLRIIHLHEAAQRTQSYKRKPYTFPKLPKKSVQFHPQVHVRIMNKKESVNQNVLANSRTWELGKKLPKSNSRKWKQMQADGSQGNNRNQQLNDGEMSDDENAVRKGPKIPHVNFWKRRVDERRALEKRLAFEKCERMSKSGKEPASANAEDTDPASKSEVPTAETAASQTQEDEPEAFYKRWRLCHFCFRFAGGRKSREETST